MLCICPPIFYINTAFSDETSDSTKQEKPKLCENCGCPQAYSELPPSFGWTAPNEPVPSYGNTFSYGSTEAYEPTPSFWPATPTHENTSPYGRIESGLSFGRSEKNPKKKSKEENPCPD